MKKIILSLLLSSSLVIMAQEDSKLKISGSVDVYYQTYLDKSDKSGVSFGSSFADQSGFALGMANLIASYDFGKTGVVADVVFGPRGDAAIGQAAGAGTLGQYINQLYVYWNVSESVKLTLGRFNTFLGYEVISPTANFNYSTSRLFSNGPFSHVGLKADFTLSEDFSLMLALMNTTDTNINADGEYSIGTQLGYKGQFLNFYYDSGAKLGWEIDYTGGFDLADSFYLGINAAYNDDNPNFGGNGFYGVALYPQYTTSESFALGLRGEYFANHGAVVNPSVFATTLTGSYTVESLTIKPEIRLDSWSKSAPYAGSSSLSSFALAAIYAF